MRKLWLTSVVLLTACDGGPLEGDWFACGDIGCSQLMNVGVRFDGEVWMPLATGNGSFFDENLAYCHIADQGGTYSIEGDILTINSADSITSGSSNKAAPEADVAPAITCATDTDCPSGAFCNASQFCEFPPTNPPPVTEPPSNTTLKFRFEISGDRASLRELDGNDSFLIRSVPTQDTLPCPSGIGDISIDGGDAPPTRSGGSVGSGTSDPGGT